MPLHYKFVLAWGSLGSGNGQFSRPCSVAVGSSGNVYVTDIDNSRVQKFNGSGKYITQWGSEGSGAGQFDKPIRVAVDSMSNVYVADTSNNRVQKFDGSGKFLLAWGSYGSGNGQFNFAYDVAVDSSGNVYVIDFENNRVEKFAPYDITHRPFGTHLVDWNEILNIVEEGGRLVAGGGDGGGIIVTSNGVIHLPPGGPAGPVRSFMNDVGEIAEGFAAIQAASSIMNVDARKESERRAKDRIRKAIENIRTSIEKNEGTERR